MENITQQMNSQEFILNPISMLPRTYVILYAVKWYVTSYWNVSYNTSVWDQEFRGILMIINLLFLHDCNREIHKPIE